MTKVLLDTSFILAAVRKNIDFIEELEFRGYEILIPKQVFAELDGLTKSTDEAHTALRILQNYEGKFDDVDLKNYDVDQGIINFAQKNKDVIIATMDSNLKGKIRNRKLVIRGEKRLEVV